MFVCVCRFLFVIHQISYLHTELGNQHYIKKWWRFKSSQWRFNSRIAQGWTCTFKKWIQLYQKAYSFLWFIGWVRSYNFINHLKQTTWYCGIMELSWKCQNKRAVIMYHKMYFAFILGLITNSENLIICYRPTQSLIWISRVPPYLSLQLMHQRKE